MITVNEFSDGLLKGDLPWPCRIRYAFIEWVIAIATIASTAVSVAGAAGAFDGGGGGGGEVAYGGTVREAKDQTEALHAEKMLRLRMGRSATILTSPRGALDEPNVYRPGLKSKLGA